MQEAECDLCGAAFQILTEEETLKGNNKQVVKETNLSISAYQHIPIPSGY